ncbi:hypothetical protein LTR78_010477 [Recurvomyces mirabilis]|uniref:Zn(2)-C6 fungal-type domain-containing protein n=1 Tax=Recurvomyces mirabilis TaxID=574656 RepID=A0AAE0TLS6_9PEZI|nr:hypothetical protein LTR78_010477 [Recurvomyces mirabilis]KAK5150370.1 hypothetical protein LTS14_010209 [Recurvomyces mirabilis]
MHSFITGLQQFMLGIGSLVASWIAYGGYTNFPATTSKQWRISLGIQIVPAGFLAGLILLFPESPRWLLDHGHAEEGLHTLAKLHAHGDTEDPWVRAEFDQIQDMITYEHENEAKSYAELFANRSSLRRLFLACALQAACQMTGVSAIQYYSPVIFAQIGIPTGKTLQYQGINSIIALVAQFLCIMCRRQARRKKPLPPRMASFAHPRSSDSSQRRARAATAVQACQTCRNRKSKCDEQRPKCGLCQRLNVDCEYREPLPTK